MANSNLHKAKKEKNDEFYTQLSDIEKELKHYKEHFKDKVVFLNCDDPEKSEFWKFFTLKFEDFKLKKLIATHFRSDGTRAYKLVVEGDINGDGKIDGDDMVKTMLKQNGDFRSEESIELLKEADIVVTNPPFSLFREYIAQLMEYNKKFLVVGGMNNISYTEVFPLIKENLLWFGNTNPKQYEMPDIEPYKSRSGAFYDNGKLYDKFGNHCWFTNMDHSKRHEEVVLYKCYNEKDYPKYDNYAAINVDKIKEIPKDYYEPMGVPVGILEVFNKDQFEILGTTLSQHSQFVRPFKKYNDVKQVNKKGKQTAGGKINTVATLLLKNRPVDKTYYVDASTNGYLIGVYIRIIIKRRKK